MWKKRLAKEWLIFLACWIGIIIIALVDSLARFGVLHNVELVKSLAAALVLYGLVLITRWAVKTLKTKSENKEIPQEKL